MSIISRGIFYSYIEKHRSLAHTNSSRMCEHIRVIRVSKSNEGRILSVDKKQLARVIPYISLFG